MQKGVHGVPEILPAPPRIPEFRADTHAAELQGNSRAKRKPDVHCFVELRRVIQLHDGKRPGRDYLSHLLDAADMADRGARVYKRPHRPGNYFELSQNRKFPRVAARSNQS